MNKTYPETRDTRVRAVIDITEGMSGLDGVINCTAVNLIEGQAHIVMTAMNVTVEEECKYWTCP